MPRKEKNVQHRTRPSILQPRNQKNTTLNFADFATYFGKPNLVSFSLDAIVLHPQFSKHQGLRPFVKILQEWNRKVKQNVTIANGQAEYMRCKFIYSSVLYILMAEDQVQVQLLHKLQKWVGLAEKKSIFNLNILKSKQYQGDYEDWKVRHTFRSNVPELIDQYDRKMLEPRTSFKDQFVRSKGKTPASDRNNQPFWKDMKYCRQALSAKQIRKYQQRCKRSQMYRDQFNSRNFNNFIGTNFKKFRTVNTSPRESIGKEEIRNLKKQIIQIKNSRLGMLVKKGRYEQKQNVMTLNDSNLTDVIGGNLISAKLQHVATVKLTKKHL